MLLVSTRIITGGHRLRDVETEEMIDSMQTKLQSLEQENSMLKNKVIDVFHHPDLTLYVTYGVKSASINDFDELHLLSNLKLAICYIIFQNMIFLTWPVFF